MLLRGAAKGWRPYETWDGAVPHTVAGAITHGCRPCPHTVAGAGLSAAAGEDEVEVAVVEKAGSCEVHPWSG